MAGKAEAVPQYFKDFHEEFKGFQDENARQHVESRKDINGLTAQVGELTTHIGKLTKAVETIHGPIGTEYDDGPSGRSDDS